MQSVLPYTTNPEQISLCEKVRLLDSTSASVTGPCVTRSEPQLKNGGLLHNWDLQAAKTLTAPPPRAITWDLSWGPAEARWEQTVHRCLTPEDVEKVLPSKWIAYNIQSDCDETLAKVCKLCTALVNRFVELSEGNKANVSTGKWRQHKMLADRLGAVVELLEASVGDAIPILNLRDPEYIRQCWEQMAEEERADIVAVLGLYDENAEE